MSYSAVGAEPTSAEAEMTRATTPNSVDPSYNCSTVADWMYFVQDSAGPPPKGHCGGSAEAVFTPPAPAGSNPKSQADCPAGTKFTSSTIPGTAGTLTSCNAISKGSSPIDAANKSLTDFWNGGILNKGAIVAAAGLVVWLAASALGKKPSA